MKSRKVNHQIHWRPEQNAKYWFVRNAETNFGRQSLRHHERTNQSLPEECVVKVVNEDGNENCSQKTTWASKRPQVTLRNTWAHTTPTFQACFGKPRVICRRGTLTQFHQRVAIGRTRIYKDMQHIQRIVELSSMMLSRHRRIISLPKSSSKRSTRRCTYLSILDRFQNHYVFRAMPIRNN